jgi:RHS repeat-associated protein
VTHQSDVFTYEYDEVGRLSRITYPSASSLVASFTQTDTSSGWNENGQLLCLRYLKGGDHLQRFEYSYDDSGNRIQMIDTPENLANQITWAYNYDWLNRLSEVKRNGDTFSLYAYDESDNRIELQLPQADEVWTYGFDVADRILSRSLNISGGGAAEFETFEHDDDGNMTSRTLTSNDSTTNYFWTTDNRLRKIEEDSVQQAVSKYDAAGIRRFSQRTGEAYPSSYYSSGGISISELARDGTSLSFIQGHQLLGLKDGSELFYYISDGLGSVRLLVDSDGDVVASFSNDEFGVQETSSGTRTDLNYQTYVGALGVRNDLDASGLLYMRQRYYDPQLGRFLNQDPIGFAGGLNLYGYVGNNPTNYMDPGGTYWKIYGSDQLKKQLVDLLTKATKMKVKIDKSGALSVSGKSCNAFGQLLEQGQEDFTAVPIQLINNDDSVGIGNAIGLGSGDKTKQRIDLGDLGKIRAANGQYGPAIADGLVLHELLEAAVLSHQTMAVGDVAATANIHFGIACKAESSYNKERTKNKLERGIEYQEPPKSGNVVIPYGPVSLRYKKGTGNFSVSP